MRLVLSLNGCRLSGGAHQLDFNAHLGRKLFRAAVNFCQVTVKYVQFDAITEVETPGGREGVLYTFILQLIFCILQFDAIKDVDNYDLSLACLKVLEARCSIKARPSSEHVSEMLPLGQEGLHLKS